VRTAWSFGGQTVVKYLLTEGDKLVLTSLATRYHQGVYALVNNYGIVITKYQSTTRILIV
jgi:oligosaccharide translocation protein RFT1